MWGFLVMYDRGGIVVTVQILGLLHWAASSNWETLMMEEGEEGEAVVELKTEAK